MAIELVRSGAVPATRPEPTPGNQFLTARDAITIEFFIGLYT
jgi:hypothetical protein